jgi:ABC-type antimicrobial peptide transport system permease subunit
MSEQNSDKIDLSSLRINRQDNREPINAAKYLRLALWIIIPIAIIAALVIALTGRIIGLVAASFLQVISVSTINFNTFSDVAFNFSLSPSIIIWVMVFAFLMGILGGFLPAVRASRLKIIEALRAE